MADEMGGAGSVDAFPALPGMSDAAILELGDEYIGHGVGVFVIELRELPTKTEKVPTTRHGHADATTDAAVLAEQLATARTARPGAVLGLGGVFGAIGAVVVDYDVKNGAVGGEQLERHRAVYGDVIDTVSYTSISGAVNTILSKPAGAGPVGNHSPWPDVDVRSDAGWVVIPGVETPWGEWAWRSGELADIAAAEMPAAMFGELRAASAVESAPANSAAVDEWLEAGAGPTLPEIGVRVTEWCETIAQTGNRNPTLFEAVSWLRRVDPCHIDRADAFGQLSAAWLARMATDGERGRANEPDEVLARAVGYAAAVIPAAMTLGRPSLSIPVAWNDAHVAAAFAAHLGNEWVHVPAWATWLQWDGKRWATDDTESIQEHARLWIIDLTKLLVETMSADEQGLKTLRSAAYYKSVRALEGIVRMTGRIKAVRPEVFDAHPRLLNVGNGVVDLATGELGPHDPTLFLSKLAGGDYVPGLKHRDVEAVIGCVDPDTRPTLQQLLGAAASGEASADMVPILDGAGSNGKTTVLIAASAALGDYAASVPTALVMQSARDEHPQLYETLRGLRIAMIEETEEDGGLRVERVKQLSGGGTISARPMRGNWYTFEPTHTLVIATNHRPIVNSAEFSIWRRLKLVPFPYRYVRAVASATDRPIDAGLRDRAKRHKAVRSAFLTFIVDGAVEAYGNGGGDVPLVLWSEAVTAATNEWRGAEDVIGRFLAERVRFDAAASVKGTEVFEAWKEWCEAENRPPGQAKNFHRRVQSHGSLNSAAEAYVRDGSTWYRGLECLSGHHSDLSDWNT